MSVDLFNSLLKESLNNCNVKVGDHNGDDATVKECNKSQSVNESQENKEDAYCLITGEPLTDKYITLVCNHRFNYIPLMKERCQWIGNYKNNHYCYQEKISKKTQMVCPYCRTVTDGILPWFNEVNGKTIVKSSGVNWPKKHWYLKNKCLYTFASGIKKGKCCDKGAFGLFCSQHEKYKDRYDNNGTLIVKPKKGAVFSCMHVLARGKRKGCLCGKKARARTQENTGLILYHCSSHCKYYV